MRGRRGLLLVLLASLLGCQSPARLGVGLSEATPTSRPPTRAEYLGHLCVALTDWAYRHRDWHASQTHVAPEAEHWDEAFVPTVDLPFLAIFANPPREDHENIAEMRERFEEFAAKFTEAGERGRVGDRSRAGARENEGFEVLGQFFALLTEYGINEETCPTFFEVTIPDPSG